MAFIEHRLAGDPTNWWAPNHACVESMLRSCGFQTTARPSHEAYLCAPQENRTSLQSFTDPELRAATGSKKPLSF